MNIAAGAALAAASLAGCGPGGRTGGAQASAADPAAAERAYRPPPAIEAAMPLAGGRTLLIGRADPGARVRLATPAGRAVTALADKGGHWRILLAPSSAVRLFGLSMIEGGRAMQAEGYLAVTPRGSAAQLRAGAAARVLAAGPGLRILAADFDRKGGTAVSGTAAPGADLSVRVDGAEKGRTRADGQGRFALALDEPLSLGDHQLEFAGAGSRAVARIAISPPAPGAGPFSAALTPSGWRIDWLTPGGGTQTTLLIGVAEGAR
ncbi:MAG: hypothetical protein ACR2F8_13905 [Caulobacteraceae bacterium]